MRVLKYYVENKALLKTWKCFHITFQNPDMQIPRSPMMNDIVPLNTRQYVPFKHGDNFTYMQACWSHNRFFQVSESSVSWCQVAPDRNWYFIRMKLLFIRIFKTFSLITHICTNELVTICYLNALAPFRRPGHYFYWSCFCADENITLKNKLQ